MEPTFYFQGKPDEWRIVPFSSLEFDNITLDENYTVLNDSFWTDPSRAIWSDAQNIAWHYANQLVAMHNCPFTIEQTMALGFDLNRMYTDGNGLLRLDSRIESPGQSVPVHVQSA